MIRLHRQDIPDIMHIDEAFKILKVLTSFEYSAEYLTIPVWIEPVEIPETIVIKFWNWPTNAYPDVPKKIAKTLFNKSPEINLIKEWIFVKIKVDL